MGKTRQDQGPQDRDRAKPSREPQQAGEHDAESVGGDIPNTTSADDKTREGKPSKKG